MNKSKSSSSKSKSNSLEELGRELKAASMKSASSNSAKSAQNFIEHLSQNSFTMMEAAAERNFFTLGSSFENRNDYLREEDDKMKEDYTNTIRELERSGHPMPEIYFENQIWNPLFTLIQATNQTQKFNFAPGPNETPQFVPINLREDLCIFVLRHTLCELRGRTRGHYFRGRFLKRFDLEFWGTGHSTPLRIRCLEDIFRSEDSKNLLYNLRRSVSLAESLRIILSRHSFQAKILRKIRKNRPSCFDQSFQNRIPCHEIHNPDDLNLADIRESSRPRIHASKQDLASAISIIIDLLK